MEIKNQMANLLITMHGGLVKFDRWLSTSADFLSKQDSIPERFVALFPVMPDMSNSVPHPSEIIDNLINTLEKAKIWEYVIKSNNGTIQVVDRVYNHVMEEVLFTPDNLQSLANKYEVDVDADQ